MILFIIKLHCALDMHIPCSTLQRDIAWHCNIVFTLHVQLQAQDGPLQPLTRVGVLPKVVYVKEKFTA